MSWLPQKSVLIPTQKVVAWGLESSSIINFALHFLALFNSRLMMKNPLLLFIIGASLLLLGADSVSAFQPISRPCIVSSYHRTKCTLHESRFDDADERGSSGYEIRGENSSLRPETTFGAENVPVDQRPSNEYLNLLNEPTYGWASQDSGDLGLVLRLAAIYIGFFFLV